MKDLNGVFTKEDTMVDNEHIKKFSIIRYQRNVIYNHDELPLTHLP